MKTYPRRTARKSYVKSVRSGGFYPSIMGGVISNAPLFLPVALRQGLNLVSKYRKTRKQRARRMRTRKHKRTARKSR